MKKFLFTATLLSAVILPAQAPAQDGSAMSSVRVSYRDLDLRTAAGRATLQGRLNGAVRKLCPRYYAVGIGEILERGRCLRQTSADARRQARIVIARASLEGTRDTALAAR